jgi:hypothetical protein
MQQALDRRGVQMNGSKKPDDPMRRLGNASSHPTIKQQREIKKTHQRELEESKKANARRQRLITIVIAGISVVAVASLVGIAGIVTKGPGASSVAAIRGVQVFKGLTSNHVTSTVAYNPLPPVGGNHSATVLNCGIYTDPVPNEPAVHSLEHSAVWVTYDPKTITGAQLKTLQSEMPKTYAILSPFAGLPSPIVASAWGAQLKIQQVGDPRITQFLAKYRESKSAPEPSAPCTGGIDGPGKIS